MNAPNTDLAGILSKLRRLDRARYPELATLSEHDIYAGKMGPGGLYLAARMARELRPAARSRVLDLGCGKGATSAFLARTSGAAVFAVDLWISASELSERFARDGLTDAVIPLNLDVTKDLPFAESYFDAVFCMDSIHYYGADPGFMERLLRHLKPGGRFCIGSPCFNREFTERERAHLPAVYDDGTDLWPVEFSRYHSPAWWAALLERTELVRVVACEELPDGVVMWEDELRFNIESGAYAAGQAATDFAQYAYGYANEPYLTHFVLTAEKR